MAKPDGEFAFKYNVSQFELTNIIISQIFVWVKV